MPGNTESLVILVHGTVPSFGPMKLGKKPTWTAADAIFCKELKQRFSGPLATKEFLWSGKNSHRARLEAAHRLATWLREEFKAPRFAAYYLIGHSHGGNVALYSLKMLTPELRRRVGGVVCLGTPFFHCIPRPEHQLGFAALGGLLPMICFEGLTVLLAYCGYSAIANDLNHHNFQFLSNLPASAKEWFVCLSMLTIILGALIGIYSAKVEQHKKALADWIRSDAEDSVRLFCAYAKGDEAYRWLDLLQLPFTATFELTGVLIGSSYFLTNIACKVGAAAHQTFGATLSIQLFIAFVVLGIVGFAFAVSVVLTLIAAIVLRTTFFSFGEGLAVALTQDAHVRVTPPNRNSAILRKYEYGRSYFSHAHLHDDLAVISDIVEWLRGSLRNDLQIFAAYR